MTDRQYRVGEIVGGLRILSPADYDDTYQVEHLCCGLVARVSRVTLLDRVHQERRGVPNVCRRCGSRRAAETVRTRRRMVRTHAHATLDDQLTPAAPQVTWINGWPEITWRAEESKVKSVRRAPGEERY